jgi:hypothetical protein
VTCRLEFNSTETKLGCQLFAEILEQQRVSFWRLREEINWEGMGKPMKGSAGVGDIEVVRREVLLVEGLTCCKGVHIRNRLVGICTIADI